MPLTDAQIDLCVARYRRERDRYAKLAAHAAIRCEAIVADALWQGAIVRWRTKAPDHFAAKLARPDVRGRFDTVDQVFADISDLAGVRVTTYSDADRSIVVAEIGRRFAGPGQERPDVEQNSGISIFGGYRATHCNVCMPAEGLGPEDENLRDTRCEIQVCTVLAHVFNEIEHGLNYKCGGVKPDARAVRLLKQLHHLSASGDMLIDNLFDEVDRQSAARSGRFVDVHDFVARMAPRLGATRQFSVHAKALYDVLQWLGLDTPQAIDAALGTGPNASLAALARQAYARTKQSSGAGIGELLDDGSSDLLLAALLERYADGLRQYVARSHFASRRAHGAQRIAAIAQRYDASAA